MTSDQETENVSIQHQIISLYKKGQLEYSHIE